MEHGYTDNGIKQSITPARRYSYLVGENESVHTAQEFLLKLLQIDSRKITLSDIESVFDVEKVAKCKIEYIDLPNAEDIYEAKYQKVINIIENTVKENEHEEYIKYVRDMNKDDLMKFSAALLKVMFSKELGSDFKKDLTIVEKGRHINPKATRVFLTIGKMDNLKKGTLLDFLKDTTKLDKDNFNNIEIMTKFTFMDVNNEVVDKVIKKIYNQKLNNRIIRIEKAKKR